MEGQAGEVEGAGGIGGSGLQALGAEALAERPTRPAPVLRRSFDQRPAIARRAGLEPCPQLVGPAAGALDAGRDHLAGQPGAGHLRRHARHLGRGGLDVRALGGGGRDGRERGLAAGRQRADRLQAEQGGVDRAGRQPHRRRQGLQLLARQALAAGLVGGDQRARGAHRPGEILLAPTSGRAQQGQDHARGRRTGSWHAVRKYHTKPR